MIAIGSPKFYICRKDTKYNPQIVREIEKSDEKQQFYCILLTLIFKNSFLLLHVLVITS